MESFIIYMAKASGLLAVFFIAYYIFLRKETFFNSNRWFLLLGLLTAAALPAISYTKIIWIDPAPKQQAIQTQVIDLNQLLAMQDAAVNAPAEIGINWYDVMAGIYIAGVLFFLARFIFNFISLRKVIKGQQAVKDGGFTFIDTPNVQSPFSFFHYIVYNSAILQPQELESILCHEKVHSRQNHSVDMLASQLFCIAFWFNPFAWLYKKSLSQNLEFIADFEAMKQLEDKTSYQKTLLKITIQPSCTAITNHFYQSLIKKRIVMLNKELSKKWNSWKYAIILPALTAFIFLFQIKTVAQEKESPKTSSANYQKTKIAIEVNKDSKEEDLNKETKIFKERFDTDVTFSNVTRNPKSEITGIKVTVKDKAQSKVYEVAGAEPIAPFTIEVAKSSASANNEIAFGNPQLNLGRMQNSRAFVMTDNDIIPVPTPTPMPDPRPMPYPIPVPQPGCAVQDPVFGTPGTTLVTGFGDKDALVIINGVKQKKGKSITLQPGQNVESITVLDSKDAKKKYGKEAKDGAVEVITSATAQAYSFVVDGPVSLNRMDFTDLPDFENIMTSIDFENLPDMTTIAQLYSSDDSALHVFSAKDMAQMKADLNRAFEDMAQSEKDMVRSKADMAKQQAEIKKQRRNNQISERDYNDMQREIEQAKKEIEQAKKEIQQARKEIELELKKSKSE
jgi:hypothetical protein